MRAHPGDVVEFADHLEFLAELEASKAQYDQQYDVVVQHYDLLAEYNLPVPAMQLASYATMVSVDKQVWIWGVCGRDVSSAMLHGDASHEGLRILHLLMQEA